MFDPSHVPTDKQAPWSATIDRSWADATSDKRGPARDVARRWFKDAGPYFRQVCERAGLDPETVQRRALNRLDLDAPAVRKPVVRRIVEPKPPRGRTLTLDGLTLTIRQWSKRLSIPFGTIDQRIRRELPVEGILSTTRLRVPAKPKIKVGRQGCEPQTLTHNGVTLSIEEWAERLGIAKGTIYSRLANGQTIERVLMPGRLPHRTGSKRVGNNRNARTLTHDGHTLTVEQWAERLGIRKATIHYRLRVGHAVADALSTSVLPRGVGARSQPVQAGNTVTDRSHPGVGADFRRPLGDRRGEVNSRAALIGDFPTP